MAQAVLILGTQDTAKIAAAILEENGFQVYGFLTPEPDQVGRQLHDIPILGELSDTAYLDLLGEGCYAFISFENPELYEQSLVLLEDKPDLTLVNALHSTVTFPSTLSMGENNLVYPGVSLTLDSSLGDHNVIGGHTYIGHAVQIGSHVRIGDGVMINAHCALGDGVEIGSGALIAPGVTLGEQAIIPLGARVTQDVQPFTAWPSPKG